MNLSRFSKIKQELHLYFPVSFTAPHQGEPSFEIKSSLSMITLYTQQMKKMVSNCECFKNVYSLINMIDIMFNIISKPEYAKFFIFKRKKAAKGRFLYDFISGK